MSELRRDPIAGRWVIIATERAARPHDFKTEPRKAKGGFCPFCEGNEDRTPPEIFAYRAPGTKPNGRGWSVRVVQNKYPALSVEEDVEEYGSGVYSAMSGMGQHEVIIESPRHAISPAELPPSSLADGLCMYRERMLELRKDSRLIYASIFKNVGFAAGASLEHTHSQLICTPVAPKRVQEEMALCRDFWQVNHRCLVCDIIRQELAEQARVVTDSPRYVVFTPFASRFPFEMWIVPKEHASHYEDSSPEALADLAAVMHDALRRLDVALGEPPYNYIIHTSTFDLPAVQYYHWHIEVIPRVTHIAGFEWGTGFYINPMMPEQAAHFMRDALPGNVQAAT